MNLEHLCVVIEKFRPITKCDNTAKAKSNPRYHLASWQSEITLNHIKAARDALEAAWKLDNEIHIMNNVNIKFNINNYKIIHDMMNFLGVGRTYRIPDPKSRARFPKSIVKNSGYIEDINKIYMTYDGYENAKYTYDNAIKVIENAEKEVKSNIEENERDTKNAQVKRETELKLLRLIIKYELPDDSTKYDILSHIRSKDKYLNLAIAMENVRVDWNDGCGEVEDALAEFLSHIESNTDNEILVSVENAIERFDDDQDGRYFRDCEWNYSSLYTLVKDADLIDDSQFLSHLCRGF
jgi:hypothetical protein